jgi:hypothetical protein
MLDALRGKQIFFVGGTHKSGTTWFQLLLDAHSAVSCSGEGHLPQLCLYLKQALDKHDKIIVANNNGAFREIEGYKRLEQSDVSSIYACCIKIVLAKQLDKKDALIVGDRTPHNVRYLHGLANLFPTAKFIHLVRDGRDCAVSSWFHNQRLRKIWNAPEPAGISLEAMSRKFADLWASDLMKAKIFNDENPGRMLQVRYEDLSDENTLADVFRFLGVDAGEASTCHKLASFKKLAGRNPGEEDRSSFFRKGIVGDWRNHLSPKAELVFREQAGAWLERLGYQ